MRFLVDECLSPELARIARARGFEGSSHVTWVGQGGRKDWTLKPFILEGDWTFVTRNSVDFRGPQANPGSAGQYADVEIHAGLICLNGSALDLDLQIELFEQALLELADDPDLVNKVLEITLEDEALHVRRYELPKNG